MAFVMKASWLIPTLTGVLLLAGCGDGQGDSDEQDRSDTPGTVAPQPPRPATVLPRETATKPAIEPARRRAGTWGRVRGPLTRAAAETWRLAAAETWRLAAAMLEGIVSQINSAELCLQRGDQSLAVGNYEAGYRYFQRAGQLAEMPGIDAMQGQAVALVALERYKEAVAVYGALLAKTPGDAVTTFNLAVAYDRLGHRSESIETYRRLLGRDPKHIRAWNNLAVLLQSHGRLAAAKQAWEKVVQLNPGPAAPWAALGEVLTDLNDPSGATKAFSAAAKRQPDVAGHWANVGLAAHADGQLGRAMAAYERAVAIEASDARLWRQLGSVRLTAHRTSGDKAMLGRALEAWRESLRRDPKQPDVKRWLATHAPVREGQTGPGKSLPADRD